MKCRPSRFLTTLLVVVAASTSCVDRQQHATQTDHRADSLTSVIRAKDSLINAVFADINAISDNLLQIRSREQLITAAEQDDGVRRPLKRIDADIASIDRLLEENRTKIASLERSAARLRAANLRIEGLEKMIGDLNSQIEVRKREIDDLRTQLSQRDEQVEALTETIAEHTARIEDLSDEKTQLENRLNTVYYIVGAEKELRDAQIIDRRGSVGRTLRNDSPGTLACFTQADARFLSEIPVDRKKARIISNHPEDSYRMIVDADKITRKLVIIDPERFWESSKILIISHK